MRSIAIMGVAILGVILAAPSGAVDARVDLQRRATGVVLDRAAPASVFTAPSAVRTFARRPRPDFAPLAAVPRPLSKPPLKTPARADADDAAFWRAAGAGDVTAARAEHRRLTAAGAPWPAAAAAHAVLDQLAFDTTLSGAIERRDWARIVALHTEFPGQFNCGRVTNMWAAADAYRQRGDLTAAAAVYTAIARTCARDDRLLALQRVADNLPPAIAVPVLRRAAVGGGDVATAANPLIYRLVRSQVIAAFDAGDDAAVGALIQAHAGDIATRRDAEVALFAGWSAARAGDDGLARDWFSRALAWQPSAAAANGVVDAALRAGDLATAERVAAAHLTGTADGPPALTRIASARVAALVTAGDDGAVVAAARRARDAGTAAADVLLAAGFANLRLGDAAAAAADFAAAEAAGAGAPARLGQARARIALGDLDAAAALIQAVLPAPEAVAIAADIDLRRATTAFAARDYQTALTRARSAQRAPGVAIAGLRLEAWSLFRLRRYADAAALFETLYRTTPTAAAADGLYDSLTRINRTARLARIAQETSGPLDRRLRWQGVIDR